MPNEVDIIENRLLEAHEAVFKALLADHSTRKNIFWATDSYAALGKGYQSDDTITVAKITGEHGNVIRPRTVKSKDEQSLRVKGMAEVFTPSWVCKEMIDYVASPAKAPLLLDEASWQQSVLATCLEITCGEAPFLVSRYDTVTGEAIPIGKRIGILDRKLRVVGENTSDGEYARWALLALGSVYGYEWQGDSLLLAREAVLATFADYYRQRFGREPDEALLLQAAEIISWNLWQMDGLKAVVPCTCHDEVKTTADLFGGPVTTVTPCPGCAKDDISLHNGVRCRLRRWLPEIPMPDATQSRGMIYHARKEGGGPHGDDGHDKSCPYVWNAEYKIKIQNTKYPMKFDFVIGNPPYQEEKEDNGRQPPIYDKFMTGAYKTADKVLLITPARFLFNAGQTPKNWNRAMLSDAHLKVLDYEQDSSKVFSNTDIKGGVAITYRDKDKDFGPIDVFTSYKELNSILHKVKESQEKSLSDLFCAPTKFDLNNLYEEHPEYRELIGAGGKDKLLRSNIFGRLSVFHELKEDKDDIAILGQISNKRTWRYINKFFLDDSNGQIGHWKVLIAESNNSGALGETLSAPLIGKPLTGYTQTFFGIGLFDTEAEASNALKYVTSKFARAMLGVLKITQHNPPAVWKYVPLQDFTSSSDIDWGASIHDIDRQLYGKYGLSQDETDFIERMVKPME